MWQWDRLILSIRIAPRAKGEKGTILDWSVVLDLWKVLKDTYCHVFFNNFFNSTTLIQKLHDNRLYGLGTACSNKINKPQMKKDKKMKRGDWKDDGAKKIEGFLI